MLFTKFFAQIIFITAILFNITNGVDPNYILSLVNQERQKNRLSNLTLDSRLTRAAQLHTDYMASIKNLTHDDRSGSLEDRIRAQGYNWSAVAENIAKGQVNETAAIKTWMNSSQHRQNILSPKYKHLGVGYSNNGNYWTQDFGTPA
ncbi:CAP domain-containing protein [Gigaspora rosea]|uniref:CAP domain-containing protein n=1 Tax=Gigaspora rosea TaxID=44941 RepID=A0A397UCC8_9GLOM|nr:CAP domain-containing protein [Gigaspora rosea]